VRIYSGVPLLFRAVDPREVFERIKEDYSQFLESVGMTLGKEVNKVKDKFVIKRFDIGLESLKEEMKKAKTIESTGRPNLLHLPPRALFHHTHFHPRHSHNHDCERN